MSSKIYPPPPPSKNSAGSGPPATPLEKEWRPDPTVSMDENFYDWTMIRTRFESKNLVQGAMFCILTKARAKTENENKTENYESNLQTYYSNILSTSSNMQLFKPLASDVHAEAHALSSFARNPRQTTKFASNSCNLDENLVMEGGTCYVTMPPCKTCFGLLISSGIKRIVTCRKLEPSLDVVAVDRGVEVVVLQPNEARKARRDKYFEKGEGEGEGGSLLMDEEEVKRRREARKAEKKKHQEGRAEKKEAKKMKTTISSKKEE